jgi:glycosyl hydrolase family 2
VKKLVFLLVAITAAVAADWKPVEGQMMSRWASEVSAEDPWPEYPRPQMVRDDWQNLNGLWDYAVVSSIAPQPQKWDGKILVPFAIESALSGVKKPVTPQERLWYRRSFTVPAGWTGQRLLLHFGAVDWQAEVYVNGFRVGEHRGGYTPFSFDVTDYLTGAGDQELVVSVWDPTDAGTQARGKQVLEPRGIWYTAVTGIWQTVWIEPVPDVSIERLKLRPDVDNKTLWLTASPSVAASGYQVRAVATAGGSKVSEATGKVGAPLKLAISNPKLWSPDSPNLYDLEVSLTMNGSTVDRVASYFAMRKIALGKDKHGRNLMFLNNEPVFQLGPLDQGWWPDGLYTAPNDEALKYDIEITKKLHFNMARKHVKVEPARWYYHCDKLGLLVWQDMPSGFYSHREPHSLFVQPEAKEDAKRDGVSAAQFESELREMIDNFDHFPSIVAWVPFNEGWGQYDTPRIAKWVKQYDPSRLVNAVSGWTDRGVGDMYDAHIYPGPGLEQNVGEDRATVLGEFGGLGWPVEDHLWWNKRNWGYRTLQSRESLNAKYAEIVGNSVGLRGFGMAAAVYTQTTDVEGEVNGLMTYDREIVKYDPELLQKIHGKLYAAAPLAAYLSPTSQHEAHRWSYSLTNPGSGWQSADFDAAKLSRGAAPFQNPENVLFKTGTVWEKGKIWIRREFTVDQVPDNLWLEILENVSTGTVYLNGTEILELENPRGRHRHYTHYDLAGKAGTLRPGKNVLAIQAQRDEGIPALDAGLYVIKK